MWHTKIKSSLANLCKNRSNQVYLCMYVVYVQMFDMVDTAFSCGRVLYIHMFDMVDTTLSYRRVLIIC